MIDAVYVESKGDKAIVVIRPRAALRAIFQIVTPRGESLESSS